MNTALNDLELIALGAAAPVAESRSQADAEERAIAREVAQRPERFQLLYNRYYDRMLNFFYRRTRERAAAEDLTSQLFLTAFEYLSAFERDLAFRPWLYRVATNAWISHERKRQRWGERMIGEIGRWFCSRKSPLASHALGQQERLDQLRHLLMQLPRDYREPILLRCYDELSDSEIGAALNLKPGSVRSRISRGIAMLRERAKMEGFCDD